MFCDGFYKLFLKLPQRVLVPAMAWDGHAHPPKGKRRINFYDNT